jgi:type IX secretion system PorP/SprF family membrane protein
VKVLALLVCLSFGGLLIAQQIPQYSQWSFHQFSQNPAHAGIKRCVDVHSLYRMQWVGFDGAPQSGFLTVSVPLDAKRRKYLSARHGMGVRFENDRIGQFGVNRINLAYAGHFNFNASRRLSLGLFAGAVQTGYNPGTVVTTAPDPVVNQEGSFVSPDASFGAWFNDDNYYIGLSVHNLIPARWPKPGNDSRYRMHAQLSAGYQLGIRENFSFMPAAILRIPPRGPISVDLNLHLDYKNLLGFGIGYRNTDALLLFASLKIKEQFAIVYSFDYTLSGIQVAAQNTHELSIRFTTCKPDKPQTASCPLFD